jgi:hypothetical protein
VQLDDQPLRRRLLDTRVGEHVPPAAIVLDGPHTSMTTGRIIGRRRVRS